MNELEALASRFHGLDLQFRRSGTGWPSPWRARQIVTKNERADYRITAYGSTAQEAIESLRAEIEKQA